MLNRSIIVRLFASICLIMAIACPGWAATYYFDATNGNDSNNGLSPDQAFKTISKNNSYVRGIIVPGDRVLWKCGETFSDTNMIIGGNGSDGNNIIYGQYGDASLGNPLFTVEIRCRSPYAQGSYITIQDWDISSASASGLVIGGNDNLTIKNLNIYNCHDYGLEGKVETTYGASDNVLIEDVNIYSNTLYGVWGYLGDGSILRKVISYNNGTVQNNISISPAESSSIYLYDCTAYGAVGGAGFGTAVNYSDSSTTYVRCISHDNNGGFIGHGKGTGTVTYINCLSYLNVVDGFTIGDGSASNDNSAVMYNCVAYDNTDYGVRLLSTGTHTVKNCIVWGNATSGTGWNFGRGGSAGTTISDYNCLDTSTDHPFASGGLYIDWSAWQALGYDAHSIILDPLFFDASANDYRLRFDSPCRWVVGTPISGLTTDYAGNYISPNHPDIGAYQYQPSPIRHIINHHPARGRIINDITSKP